MMTRGCFTSELASPPMPDSSPGADTEFTYRRAGSANFFFSDGTGPARLPGAGTFDEVFLTGIIAGLMVTPEARFGDQVALITAAASGIGRATAEIIGGEGGIVVGVDTDQTRLDAAMLA